MVQKAHTHRNIFASPSQTLFTDMLYLIYDEAENNPEILQHFYNLTKKLFSHKVTEFEKLTELYKSGNIQQWQSYLTKTYVVERDKVLLHSFHMYMPLFFNTKEILEIFNDEYEELLLVIDYALLQNDREQGDENFVFNTEEQIFSSNLFEKYLTKRKIELAEYLSKLYNTKVVETSLCNFIHETLKSKTELMGTPISDNIDGIVTSATRNILVNQYGGTAWYEAITNDGQTNYLTHYNYKPDVESIIRIYFKEYVKYKYMQCEKTDNDSFSKIYLSKSCIPADISQTYTHIMYLYNMDIICRLFNDLKDDYYLNFSWKKIARQDMIARYNVLISEMENTIKTLDSKLSIEKQSRQLLKEQFAKKEGSNKAAIE